MKTGKELNEEGQGWTIKSDFFFGSSSEQWKSERVEKEWLTKVKVKRKQRRKKRKEKKRKRSKGENKG